MMLAPACPMTIEDIPACKESRGNQMVCYLVNPLNSLRVKVSLDVASDVLQWIHMASRDVAG